MELCDQHPTRRTVARPAANEGMDCGIGSDSRGHWPCGESQDGGHRANRCRVTAIAEHAVRDMAGLSATVGRHHPLPGELLRDPLEYATFGGTRL